MAVNVPADLRTAAGKMGQAATSAHSHRPGDDVGGVADALPGGASAGAAKALEGGWNARFKSWQTDAENQATAMTSAADNWSSEDDQATARHRQLMRRTGGMLP